MLGELRGGVADHRARRRQRRHRTVWIMASICALVLLVVIGGGMIYTWYMGKQPVIVSQPVSTETRTKPSTVSPVVDENAPVGVAIEAMTPPLKAGANASISIKTRPKAACSIAVTYDNQKSTDAGLVPKNADEFGVAMWTWTVEVGRPVGSWPVEITCAYNDRSGYGKEMLTITK